MWSSSSTGGRQSINTINMSIVRCARRRCYGKNRAGEGELGALGEEDLSSVLLRMVTECPGEVTFE